jgi:protein-tyrosine phosphatase
MYRFLREGNGVVYVHCAAGMNRSATLALAYVCKNFYFPMDVMIQTTLRQRPCMFQNPVYMNQVRELLNGRLQSPQNHGKFQQERRAAEHWTQCTRTLSRTCATRR